jgi:hypothetical protein
MNHEIIYTTARRALLLGFAAIRGVGEGGGSYVGGAWSWYRTNSVRFHSSVTSLVKSPMGFENLQFFPNGLGPLGAVPVVANPLGYCSSSASWE